MASRDLSPNARRVLEARYLARDASGALAEGWPALCLRVARSVAAAEKEFGGDPGPVEERFHAALLAREFLPNSPTLMNAGTELGQLAACFVLPIEDSLESIFRTLERMAVVHQSGGGTGFSFSRLRPAGDIVRRTHGVASGPVSFIGVFDAATAVIKQGGRRRGANMGVLRVDHPDVLEFVRAKSEEGRLANFNLSVATPDAFWHDVRAGRATELRHPSDGRVVGRHDARALLSEIAEQAWAGGDPGLIFETAVERDNPTPALGPLEATNPCGELPLLANEACVLGSLRLPSFGQEGRLDWERLDAAVDVAVRFLDDSIEVSRFPFPEVESVVRGNRKIGLGVMGFADLLVDLSVPYDSDEAVRVAERVMARVRARAERASARLAAERGAFASHAGSRVEARGLRLRNATVTSIAPTGTLSILADCSSGVEPYFALAFVRHVLDGQRLPESNARFEAALRRAGAWSPDLIEEIRHTGSARGHAAVPEAVQRLFPTAADVPTRQHLAIQRAFQRHVDNAVSKTVNLPRKATPESVRETYRAAWQLGLKGITVFREGCRSAAVLTRGDEDPVAVSQDMAGGCADPRCP